MRQSQQEAGEEYKEGGWDVSGEEKEDWGADSEKEVWCAGSEEEYILVRFKGNVSHLHNTRGKPQEIY